MRKLLFLSLLMISSVFAFAQLTVIVPFEQNNVVGQAWNHVDYNFTSEYFSIVNNNATGNYVIRIVSDDNPDHWTLTFCHIINGNGACHPPNFPWTLEGFALGDTLQLDFTIMVNSINYVNFSFMIESDTLEEPLQIPFHFQTADYVDANDESIAEANYALKQNYPNPFNPVTTISYTLENKANDAVLEILNLKGQIIRTFANLQKGEHEIIWNGKDASGKEVSSGMYFYRINGLEKQSDVKRMILMK